MTKTAATLFSGGEGAGIGLQAAGYTLVWGIEYDADIAAVANANLGEHVRVANILDCDPAEFVSVDWLHASPPCPNFSIAKEKRGETENDLALARKVAEFVTVLHPNVFTLENVWLYRRSESWNVIANALNRAGYWFDVTHVNAADFGVPQTRKRMWVRARLGQMVPYLPSPEPWQGWYAAIEDLIPGLPETEFASWQLERMGEAPRETILMTDQSGTKKDRAPQTRLATLPAFTVLASATQNWRAFVIDNQNGGRKPTVRDCSEPMFSMTASHSPKAFVQGRVLQVTARCLARFQTFPDWYELPESNALARRIIGNAVPPLLMEKIARQEGDLHEPAIQ